MKNTCIRGRFERNKRGNNRGMVLVLVLVLATLTSLLATAGLEKIKQRTLLGEALLSRAQSNELLTQALQQGLLYSAQLRGEDFDNPRRGIYATVLPQRIKTNPRRVTRPVSNAARAVSSGFSIELFSQDAVVQTAAADFYVNCKLLLSAYVETPQSPRLFAEVLIETALPLQRAPSAASDGTAVDDEARVVTTQLLALRVFN